MAESTLKITQKFIINEGTPDEQCYDQIKEYCIGYTVSVYMVVKNGKYGILDNSGRLITPLIYDYLWQCSSYDTKQIYSNYFYAKKDGKLGIITSDNRIIFPFLYDTIDLNEEFNEKTGLIRFYDSKADKYGLAKWPSGELVHAAQWDAVQPLYSPGALFLCGEITPNNIRILPNYRWNIVWDNGKKLFENCRYVQFIPHYNLIGNYDYNIGVTEIENYHAGVDFMNVHDCSIEIFYRDGTILYSGKCNNPERLRYANNAFVIRKYGTEDEYSLLIFNQDKNGKHQLYSQDFRCKGAGVNEASYLVSGNPELQKMIKS